MIIVLSIPNFTRLPELLARHKRKPLVRGNRAGLAVHDEKAGDDKSSRFLPVYESKENDGRNFVKKAANCSLRQIGKRNPHLNERAIATANKMLAQITKSERRIVTNALREPTNAGVQRVTL